MPDFVFQRDIEVVGEGRELLGKFVEAALPSSGCNHIMFPAPSSLRGLRSMRQHRCYWVTYHAATWTRRHIQEYTDENKGRPPRRTSQRFRTAPPWDDKADPLMGCVERFRDVVYIPRGWGHTFMLIDDNTFG